MSKSDEERRREAAHRMHLNRQWEEFQLKINEGLRRVRWKFEGDRNVMRRPEVAAKMRGDQNPMKRDDVKAKHLASIRAYHAKRKAERDA